MPTHVLLEAPITFDVGDQVVHAPMVEVVVGGLMTKLILDTGSTDHILTTELTDRLGLKGEPGEPGTDGVGASIESWTLDDVSIRIGDFPVQLHDVIAIAGPVPFEGWGVGGFLSPQHLHPTAHVVLDFVSRRLHLVEGGEAEVASWVAARSPDLIPLSLERASDDSTVLVHAAIEPFDDVVTMLDSGGKRTEFALVAVPGLEVGARQSAGRGVGGGQSFGSQIQGAILRLGGVALSLPAILVRDEMGNAPGLIGMDLLRETVLVVSADRSRPVIWLIRRNSLTGRT